MQRPRSRVMASKTPINILIPGTYDRSCSQGRRDSAAATVKDLERGGSSSMNPEVITGVFAGESDVTAKEREENM